MAGRPAASIQGAGIRHARLPLMKQGDPMYSFSAKQLADQLPDLMELADIDEVVVTRDGGENLVIVRESVWRAMQDAAHLFATDINADRLLRSLQQLRADFLSEPEVE